MSIGISTKALKKILLINALAEGKRLGTSNQAALEEDFAKDVKDFELADGDATSVKHLRVGRIYPGALETSILPYLNESHGDVTVSLAHRIDIMSNFSFTDSNGKTYYRVRIDTTSKKPIDGDAQGRSFLEQSPTTKWVWTSSLLEVPDEVQIDGQFIVHKPHDKYKVLNDMTLHPTLDPNIGETKILRAGNLCSVAKEKKNPSLTGDSPIFCTIMIDGQEYHIKGTLFDSMTKLSRLDIALAITTDSEKGEKSILPVHIRNSFVDDSGETQVTMYTCEYPVDIEGHPLLSGYNKIGTNAPDAPKVAELVIPESELAMPMKDFVADASNAPKGLVTEDADLNGDKITGDLAIRMKAFKHGDDIYYECLSYNDTLNGTIIDPARPDDNTDFIDGAHFVMQSELLPASEVINWSNDNTRAICIGMGEPSEGQIDKDIAAYSNSVRNGALKVYYEDNPDEDLWDIVRNEPANYENHSYGFVSYDRAGNELATGRVCKVFEEGCGDETFVKVVVTENSVAGWVGREFYIQGDACVGEGLFELYEDSALTIPVNVKVKITDHSIENCVRDIRGAIYAPGAQFPRIVLGFEDNVNARVKFTYTYMGTNEATGESEKRTKSVFPWGDAVFCKDRRCGAASLPQLFDGIITATEYRQNAKDGSILKPSNFVPTNLKIELVRE